MGNSNIRDFFGNQENFNKQKEYLENFSNAELLNHHQFLLEKWTTMNMEKHKDGQNFFDWSNVQTSSVPSDQIEENIKLHEFKENLLIGRLPKNSVQDLLNPAVFDESQTAFSPANVSLFKDHQNQKFLVLYQIFFLMQNTRKKEFSSFQAIKNSLSSGNVHKAAEVGIRSGIHLLISLLREASQNNAALRNDTLDFLIELFAEVKPLSLWGKTKIEIILDKSLHTVADYLEEQILSEKTQVDGKSKALKVLFSLGLLRGSLPNLLSVVNLLRKLNLPVDLANETKLLKNESPENKLDFEKRLKAHVKLFFKSAIAADAPAPEKSPYVSFTTDGKFLYLHSETEGLMKIGTGFGYTMFGKIYKHLPDYRLKERGSLALVQNRLFYRSQRIAPLPFVEIDPRSLEEIEGGVVFDNSVPNALFAEMTTPDIEFPHPQVEIDENSKTQQGETKDQEKNQRARGATGTTGSSNAEKKRDIRLMRPPQRSPVFTEGRYLYVVSQWTVESRGRGNEEDDDEDEGGEANEPKQAKFGVDIYDPLNEFEHIRSVELWEPKVADKKDTKAKQKAVMTLKTLDQASFSTNGTELVIATPIGVDEATEIKYRYFSLRDGKSLRTSGIKEANYFSNLCYDSFNNVIWGVSDNKKTFEILACYTNTTIPEKFHYSEESDLHVPYENEKIVELALEGLGLVGEDEEKGNEKLERVKEEWQLLLSLGFTNKDKSDEMIKSGLTFAGSADQNQISKAMQLFILANISRLADSYANLKQTKQVDGLEIENFRRPYCVHLIPKVFEYLEEFVDYYGSFFLDGSDNIYDLCSFLCTLRIIKFNFASSELFADQLKKLKIDLPSKRFAEKMQKLIMRVFETTPSDNKEFDDIRKAVYSEVLSILRYNLSIIYPTIDEVLKVLRQNLDQIEKRLNRDVVLSMLGYLTERQHIQHLVAEILNEQNNRKEDLVNELTKILEFIHAVEVKNFTKFVYSIEEYDKLPNYTEDEFISVSMAFNIEFQKELLYQVGQKVQEKNLELSPLMALTFNFTDAITKNAIHINEAFESAIRKLAINNDKKIRIQDEEEERIAQEKKEQGGSKKKEEKKESVAERINKANNDVWDYITKTFIDHVYFSQILSLQVNSLCLLASNFLIAAKTLKPISNYLSSLNKLYLSRKEIHASNLEKISTFLKEKSETFECEHPYPPRQNKKEKIHIPGTKRLRVVFDPKCDLRQNCDYLQFFSDDKYKDKITERMDRSGDISNFPKEDLIIEGDTFYYMFTSDNCRNSCWGYKFTVYASIQDSQESDWMAGFHRSTCWLASKCSAQLVNGSALQQALMQDEEQRYNNLLNSKLFSGGMEKCYFSGGKEAIWIQLSDIINEFEAGHLSEYLRSEITQDEKKQEEFLNHIIFGNTDEQVGKFLIYLQKLFSKECLWANLGGENADKIVRATFAVIIKHAGLTQEFFDCVEEVDKIVETNRNDPTIKNFVKKWQSANRMRTWLVEKKKDIDDLAERNRQTTTAAASKKRAAPAKVEEKPAKAGRGGKKTVKRKKVQKEEEVMVEVKPKEEEEEEVQPSMQVKDTEEIISRMIEQIIKKAQFLIQLIPAKHWSQDQLEKRDKQLLFRSSSHVEEYENKEEEWKRRLQQWKSVRQSRGVAKSLEDETQEIHLSLSQSVLLCLQSPVSIRRLRKQVESSYLRAICRTIGLNALTQIIISTPGSLFRQDVVGWLCTSLRGNENKLYHFTDNLQGCGFFLESAVNTSFKKMIQAIVQSMSSSKESDEIKCMLEALKWKYHGDDHSFLAEIDLFGILRGPDAQSLLRRAWGKSLENKLDSVFTMSKSFKRIDHTLVRKLLELFEIIVVLCVGKVHGHHDNQPASVAGKKDKLPSLERHISVIDEYSSEILIRQAFAVIFLELNEADKNYRNFSGLDWGAWQRAQKRKERKEEAEKKKTKGAKTTGAAGEEENVYYGEEQDGGSVSDGSAEGASRSRAAGTGEDGQFLAEEEDFYSDDAEEEEKINMEMLEEETKEDVKPVTQAKKTTKPSGGDKEEDKPEDKEKKKANKIKELIEKEESNLQEIMGKLYNPEFLYRLLSLVYKCVALGIDHVAIVVGYPKYIAILFSLLRTAPPTHKIMIIRILNHLFTTLPHELFVDATAEVVKTSNENSLNNTSSNRNMLGSSTRNLLVFGNEKLGGQHTVLAYFMGVLLEIRRKVFTENIEYFSEYSVSSEIVSLFRTLLQLGSWNQVVFEYISSLLNVKDDELLQFLALSVVGGEINGLHFGGKVAISSSNTDELFDNNVLLKNTLESSHESATIVGFSDDYKEKISEEEKKKNKDDDPRFHSKLKIGSVKDNNNPILLIHSTIAKEITNLNAIELTTIPRFNCIALDNVEHNPVYFKLSDRLLSLFSWALSPKNLRLTESKQVLLKATALKSLNAYLTDARVVADLAKNQTSLIKDLLVQATQKVITSDHLMNLELTEERLYRMLTESAETPLDLSDLKPMSATVKNNELEVLMGKDYVNMKYPLVSGYNLEKVGTQFLELICFSDVIAEKRDAKSLENKALMITPEELAGDKAEEYIFTCRILITFNYDLQKLSDVLEGPKDAKAHPGKKGGARSKLEKRATKEEAGGEEEMALPPQQRKLSQRANSKVETKVKLPQSIVNLSEKYFNDVLEEYKNQCKKEYKDIFCEKRLIDELVEYGFPRDICEEYFAENEKTTNEIMISEIAKLVEAREEEQRKQEKEREAIAEKERMKNSQLEASGDITLSNNSEIKENIAENTEIKSSVEQNNSDNIAAGEEEPEVVGDIAETPNDDIEKEEANICFKCKGDKEVQTQTEEKNSMYDQAIDFEGFNNVGKIILFKQTCHNLAIYYARRAVLNLLEQWPEADSNLILDDKEAALKFLKMVSFEAIFSSSTYCNNSLLIRLRSLLTKYYELEATHSTIARFNESLFSECVVAPIKELETKYLKDKQIIIPKKPKANAANDKDKNALSGNFFTGRINNETELDLPFIDFSLWITQIMFNSTNPAVYSKALRPDLLFSVFGLLTTVRQNKALGWGMAIFSLNFLEFLRVKIAEVLKIYPNLKNMLFSHEYVVRLHEYLHLMKQREKVESYSRRAQIVSELLISLNRLFRMLERAQEHEEKSEIKLDLEKFKVIDNLTDVSEMMENYQENKTLIASTWLQASTDLIKAEQKVIDGDHFYHKNLHTFKVAMPYTSEATIKFSEDSQTDIGDSIILTSDSKGEHSIQKLSANLSKKTIIFPAGTFYVHFPAKGSDIYSWGVNDQYQLAAGEGNTSNGPYCLETFSTANVSAIDANDTQTLILNKSGELFGSGSGSQTGVSASNVRVPTKVTAKDKVKLFSCGSNYTIFCTENNELFGVGSNNDGRMGLNWNNGTASPQHIEFPKAKAVKQISCGGNHSFVLTTEGSLYATGHNEHGQLGMVDESGNKLSSVTTFRAVSGDIAKKKISQIVAAFNFSLCIIAEKGQTYVMSCGEKLGGKLGLGDDIGNTVNIFTKIKELENVGVNFIAAKKKHVLAVTADRKIYSWGNNEHGQLGHGTNDNVSKPKLISFFESMRVTSAAAGNNHSVVIAKGKLDEIERVYVMGENVANKLNVKISKEKVNTPLPVEFFDEKNPLKVICGSNHSFLMTKNMEIPKYRDQHRAVCSVTGKPVTGPLLVDSAKNPPEFFSLSVVNALELSAQPALLICARESISSGKEFVWPTVEADELAKVLEEKFADETKREFPGTTCRNCKVSPITEVLYITMHDKDPSDVICNKCVSGILGFQVSPTIYYRLTRPLKDKAVLPLVPRTHFFNQSDTYGYNITIVPKFSEKGHDYMIEKYHDSYENFSSEFKNIGLETDEQFVDLLNNVAQKKEKSVFDLDDNITFPKDEISIRNALEKTNQEFLRKRFMILKNFNNRVKSILPFVDFSAKKNENRLRNIYSTASLYIFWDVKSDLFDKILAQDAKPASQTKIKVNRLRANKFIAKGKPDHTGEFTVFGQIFQYFKNVGYSCFKTSKEANPFSVQFVGEAAIDVGGPYREAISQMCTELQSSGLPLLIPSPNQKNDSGQFREKWALNPSANTLIHSKMYEFLGAIMGCSIRTKNFLNLDLPSIVWKQLVDVPLNRKDLENIDRYTIQCLDDVININKKGVDENSFNDLIQEKFVTFLSDGTEVELIPNGKSKMVTFDKRDQYADLVEKARLAESRKQAENLRKGLTLIIPEGLLNLLTWRELETLVCGKPILDVDLLRQNTVYRGCTETDQVIEFFWKALTEFSPEERSMYLRFVWGRSRLPLTSKEFQMKHTIEILRKGGIEPDMMLPVAHTCFFSIELPKYSNYEICRDKLKYAITNCQAIDTDGRAYDIWDEEDF